MGNELEAATPVPALFLCACGFVFRFDYPGRWVEGVSVPDGHHTTDGVADHELLMLHRALGGCFRKASIRRVRAIKSRDLCGSHCYQAKGEECCCSCGGGRHGLAHRGW